MARLIFRAVLTLGVLLSSAWAAGALHYRLGWPKSAPFLVPALWGLGAAFVIVAVWRGRQRWPLRAYLGALVLLLLWWATIPPSDKRDWADDVARHLVPHVDGDVVTLENVRNFDWRADDDFTVQWETRRYDLSKLRSVDMAVSHWMGPAIGHTLVSFGFDDGQGGSQQLVFSIEIRKERHEQFSAVAGFFKQYELALVAADERDVLAVRTNVRGEDVYLYRVQMPEAARRELFLAYLEEARELARKPQFYNTLTANCTTIVYAMARRITSGLPMDWRLLASGYLPEYLDGLGALAPGQTLDTLRQAGRITLRAQAAGRDPEFSQLIRRGIPGMEPR